MMNSDQQQSSGAPPEEHLPKNPLYANDVNLEIGERQDEDFDFNKIEDISRRDSYQVFANPQQTSEQNTEEEQNTIVMNETIHEAQVEDDEQDDQRQDIADFNPYIENHQGSDNPFASLQNQQKQSRASVNQRASNLLKKAKSTSNRLVNRKQTSQNFNSNPVYGQAQNPVSERLMTFNDENNEDDMIQFDQVNSPREKSVKYTSRFPDTLDSRNPLSRHQSYQPPKRQNSNLIPPNLMIPTIPEQNQSFQMTQPLPKISTMAQIDGTKTKQENLQENVFTKLLNDEQSENKYCVDCRTLLISNQFGYDFEQIYVSINHGIFMCYNCASTHQNNYGVEVSFVKRIMDNYYLDQPNQSSLYVSSMGSTQQQKLMQLSKWTYTQLRVLINSGGNKAFHAHMDQYDLMQETIQKRYTTVAAQYYRDHLRNKIMIGVNHKNMMVSQPEYDKGRERSTNIMKITKQIIPYSNIDSSDILPDLLKKCRQNGTNLNDQYLQYVSELEQKNFQNVDHFKQLQAHQQELVSAQSKNPQNQEELEEYRQSILNDIDSTLPPYFKKEVIQNRLEDSIIEPYSELSDYLDRDDFSNLLGVLGSFADKSASGLLSFGEGILNQFVFKSKAEPTKLEPTQMIMHHDQPEEAKSDEENDLGGVEDYIIPGQRSVVVTKQDQDRLSSTTSRFSSTISQLSIANILPKTSRESKSSLDHNPTSYKESAQVAGSKLQNIGKSVWGMFGGAVGPATSRPAAQDTNNFDNLDKR